MTRDPLLRGAEWAFDVLEEGWESARMRRATANGLVALFLAALAAAEAGRWGLLPAGFAPPTHFAAIGLAFSALLVVEVVSLVLSLARSVADAVGKHFELFSLILLRDAFKEIGHLGEPIVWATAQEPILHALADAGGALAVFLGVVAYGRLQRHRRITVDAGDQARFVAAKKLVALGLLAAFVFAGLDDARRVLTGAEAYPFFDAFFTALIFADVLLVLVSLRYTATYAVVFRNAGFALATVILRLALVAPPYVNVLLGGAAMAFALVLTLAYNRALVASGAPGARRPADGVPEAAPEAARPGPPAPPISAGAS